MKKTSETILDLDTTLSCFVGAIGYGVGYNLPSKFNQSPIVCIICCLVLGTIFDFIGNKIVSSKFYNKSKKNKSTTALLIYIGYLLAWIIVDYTLDYDLDYDFFNNIGLVIIIQMILVFIKKIRKKKNIY